MTQNQFWRANSDSAKVSNPSSAHDLFRQMPFEKTERQGQRAVAGSVLVLFHRRVLPSVVRAGLGGVALFLRRCHRLGQSGRLRRGRNLCERTASDAFARDRSRVVLRHRPHRLISRADRGRTDAGLRRGRLRAVHLYARLSDPVVWRFSPSA
jgi:hypothetical protein